MKIQFTARHVVRQRSKAFTLAEVVVTAALLTLVFVALYGGISSGYALTQVARENLRATQILVEHMEGVRLYNWNQLIYSNWIPPAFTNYYYPLTNANESPGIQYIGTMVITNATLSPATTYSDRMRAIIVTVNWTSGGVARSRALTTYVARNGVQNYIYNN